MILQSRTHFSMKEEILLKSAMKCQKNKFYVQIHAQETIIYHRHKNKNTEFMPEKNYGGSGKEEINGKIESFIDIDSFLLYIFLISSSHFTPTIIE